MRDEILKRLFAAQDAEYKKFNDILTPGADPALTIGVRKPAMRIIAKEIAGGDYLRYIGELPHQCYWEERLIHGMVIGYAKMPHDEWQELMRGFVPFIHDWALCDSTVTTQKRIKKERAETWDFIAGCLRSASEFTMRFGCIVCLDYYLDGEYIPRVLAEITDISRHFLAKTPPEKLRLKKGAAPDDAYYTMMGAAWCLAEACAKCPEEAFSLLESRCLDAVTQNKAIQKARESFRLSPADKEKLLQLKIV
ncbi:MAG: DNA alkylation repair protein [Eubacteriaceae bacterium]|jgi:3-methyladenine DNA glycosylase AlkD|nr:DNA alkylation repair protein [Eubacteriaceae bacterium]